MSNDQNTNVFIVEDDKDLRASLLFQLDAEGCRCIGFDSAEAFLATWHQEDEGCLVIDVNLPGASGLSVLERLSRSGSRLVPVVITGRGDVVTAVRAMRAGAADFIEKPFAPGIFRKSVLRALATAEQRLPLQRDTAAAFAKYATLSEREREVFQGLIEGKQGKQIAIDLGISPRTIEIHRARIMTKLEVSTLSELLRLGLILEMNQRLRSAPTEWARFFPHMHDSRSI